MTMRLLLLSNSSMKGEPYLAWPEHYIKEFTQNITKALFVPYAAVTVSYDDYTASVQQAFDPLNIEVIGLHQVGSMSPAIAKTQCLIVGGGNTFSLMAAIHKHELLFDIKDAINSGIPYIGWSAGANVACPTIKTTNDMPIEEVASFSGFDFIPLQINPHYTDVRIPNHGGEGRDLRIQEFLEKNQHTPVVGLPEGMLIEVDGEATFLKGSGEAKLFRYGRAPKNISPGLLEID